MDTFEEELRRSAELATAERNGENKTEKRVARALLAKGMTVTEIAEVTGLTVEEIQALKQQDCRAIGKLANAAELAKLPEIKLQQYEKDMITELDRQLQMEFAVNKAKEEERVKSKAEKLESAKAMLADGLDVAKVVKYTGLTVDEVQALQQQHTYHIPEWRKELGFFPPLHASSLSTL